MAKIRKRRNQKKIPTPKTEVGKYQTNNQVLIYETYRKRFSQSLHVSNLSFALQYFYITDTGIWDFDSFQCLTEDNEGGQVGSFGWLKIS